MHLQSIKISPDVNEISENIDVMNKDKSQMILIRISKAFKQQQQQAEILKRMKMQYPIIICGDMNNSAYSYVYRNIKEHLKIVLKRLGRGLGQLISSSIIPLE
jgi:endonuclease/exonuclease/phosphatase (EEP) superfamily protein YafD